MAENENLASIFVKSGLISIFTNSPIGYFSKFANECSPKDRLVLKLSCTSFKINEYYETESALSLAFSIGILKKKYLFRY